MSDLLDTNVVSEWTKPRPDTAVIAWLHGVDEDQTYLSVMTIAELRRGVELLPDGRRRAGLHAWLEIDLPARFEDRLLSVNEEVAHAWGRVMARARQGGVGLSVMDGFLAATAAVYGLRLVTRSTADFASLGIDLFNPWSSGG